MPYKKLANIIAIIHLFLVLWVIISLPLVFLFNWYLFPLIILVVAISVVWIKFNECPLNRWEYQLRGLDYDKYKTQGIFISKLFKKINIDISRKEAIKINQIFLFILILAITYKIIVRAIS
ncbi:MAG: DUF2784 family protein [Patescibacteria group bacterium]